MLHLCTVVENAKSRLYYEEILALGNTMYLPYFDNPSIILIWDETFGLQEVDSSLLHKDYILLKGLTLSDIEEKNVYLMSYLATIDSWETAVEGLSTKEDTFHRIGECLGDE